MANDVKPAALAGMHVTSFAADLVSMHAENSGRFAANGRQRESGLREKSRKTAYFAARTQPLREFFAADFLQMQQTAARRTILDCACPQTPGTVTLSGCQ